jgi:heme-degrading monooxygenase HmoA
MEAYASGNWVVKQGKENEFIQKWRAWLEWSRDNGEGLKWAKLMRSADDPKHFVSVSAWESEEARAGWMKTEAFQKSRATLRDLTDDFAGGSYDVVVAVDARLTMTGVEGTA